MPVKIYSGITPRQFKQGGGLHEGDCVEKPENSRAAVASDFQNQKRTDIKTHFLMRQKHMIR